MNTTTLHYLLTILMNKNVITKDEHDKIFIELTSLPSLSTIEQVCDILDNNIKEVLQ